MQLVTCHASQQRSADVPLRPIVQDGGDKIQDVVGKHGGVGRWTVGLLRIASSLESKLLHLGVERRSWQPEQTAGMGLIAVRPS